VGDALPGASEGEALSRAAVVVVVAGLVVAPAAAAASYSGTITFTRAEPSGLTLTLSRTSATVALGPGHVSHAVVSAKRRGNRVSFALPGRPSALMFALRLRGRGLAGTARQGTARAKVSLRRGRLTSDARLGFFTGASGPFQVLRTIREGFGNPVALDLRTGVFTRPTAGQRLAVRQEEVRFSSGRIQLAGTLTLPLGTGPFAAAAYVSGSGETLREEEQFLGGYLASRGIAVLGYDKRGVGQSGGRFPGTLASPEAISTYATDAEAAARFLAAQPEVDPKRVGLFGLSQGGWITPVAASRAPTIVSWTLIQGGPTVTQGESDYYGGIASSWTGPLADAEAEARAHPGGFDPVPFIRPLRIPMLWLYGSDDRAVPPDTSISILRGLISESPRDFTIHLYPGAPHPLFSRAGFPAGMFTDVGTWLRGHGLSS
jgi:alpha-beta hydrolase superfamily lysophospholipase